MPKKLNASLSVLFFSVSGLAFQSTPASAQSSPPSAPKFSTSGASTQCIKMVLGGQYIAMVKWWDPKTVEYTPPHPDGDDVNTKDVNEAYGILAPKPRALPVKTERIAVGQKSCINYNADTDFPRFAYVTAIGAEKANTIILGITAAVVGFAGGVACIFGTAGTTCPLVAGAVTTILTTGIGLGGGFLEEGNAFTYLGTPASVEISGTILQRQAIETAVGTAESFYRAEIDFCHSGLTDTASADKITVEFLSFSGAVIETKTSQFNSNCNGSAGERGPLTFFLNTPEIVKSVRVSTSGGDAMFIDQVKVERDNKETIIWAGRDNGNGWCLSTDAQDFRGGWENNVAGQCKGDFTFDTPAVATFGAAPGPSAAYRARIDFCHSTLVDTTTTDNITIDFMKQGTAVASKVVNGSVSDCGRFSKGYLETTINTPVVLDGVRVSTDGGNAMFIDQVEVWRDENKIFWDGRDNGGGWCLSTDANDHIGGWEGAVSGGCAKSHSFSNPAN